MIDYRPDAAQNRPDILQTCQFLVPDKNAQYRNSYGATAIGVSSGALDGACLGSRMLRNSSGTPILLAGTADKLYKVTGTSGPSDISRAAGGAYSATKWWFEQYGDEFIACDIGTATQTSTGGAAFTALSGAPKAAVMVSQKGYLHALNYDDGSAVPNGIKWCSEKASTTWTPAVGNTAGAAQLVESPGKIIGGAVIHDIVVVWKRRSMYTGTKVGGSTVWDFNMIHPYIGLIGAEAWAATPIGIIFASTNGIYVFDGSVPRQIDDGIRNTIFSPIGADPGTSIFMSHDEVLGCVFLWQSGSAGRCWAYSYVKDKWSQAYAASNNVISIGGGATFTNFEGFVRDPDYTDFATSLGGFSNALRRVHLIWSSEHKCANLSNQAGSTGIDPTVTIQTVRDPKASPMDETYLEEVIPIYGWDGEFNVFEEPASGTCTTTPRTRPSGGAQAAIPTSLSADKLRFDVGNPSANSFKVSMTFPAQPIVLNDIAYKTKPNGLR